jgi:Mg-chelatase subunit ChlD
MADTTNGRTPRVAVLLDRSGSMTSCRAAAISGINGYLQEAAADPALTDGRITIITFDSESIDVVRDEIALSTCPPLGEAEFEPRAATPLLDAIAHAVSLLERQKGRNDDPRILAILTDGYENASREHTRESIAALLKTKQEAGWLVLYLGSDQDSWSAAQDLALRPARVADISFDCHQGVALALKGASARYVACGVGDFTQQERRGVRKAAR